ncbi:MAG: hypothetical protein Phog2KO_46560 [Phototrophicaceae bacterium]
MTDNPNSDFWKQQADLDAKGLIEALASDDKLVRRRATAALGAMGVIPALSALKRALIAEDDAQTASLMSEAISALSILSGHAPEIGAVIDTDDTPENEVRTLIANLSSDNGDTVLEAAEKLSELGDKTAVEGLILAFNKQNHSIHVRLAIAEALLKLESAPVEVALLANIRHSDWHIRRNGAAILGQLKAEWAIEPLSGILSDPHPVVRRTALAALKHIGTPESRKAIARFVPSTTPQPRKKQDPRSQVSGIEVKRPGKKSTDKNENSPLLKRLEKERRAAERARRGTQPLDPEVLKRNQKRIEATQRIPNDILDQLGTILDEDDENENS